MGEIKTITLTGTPHERGYQHGKALRDDIYGLYEAWMKRSETDMALRLSETDLLSFTNKHGPYAKQYAPDIYEEMEGIAEGATIGLDRILFLNCFDEVGSLMLPGLAAQLSGQPLPPVPVPLHGCTSFAVSGAGTADGEVYIGQGWDLETFYKPLVIRIPAQNGDQEQVLYSHAGMVGMAGVNAAGLAIVDNSLKPSDQKPGVPYPVVVRKALQQTTLSDLCGAIMVAQRACGMNYVIGSPFAAVNLETSALKYSLKYIQEGIFGHANHYEAPELIELEALADWLPDTLIRSGRMVQLLKAGFGKLDLDALENVMCDHANYPNSICRHTDSPRGYKTVSTIICKPVDRLMLVTDGNPCENQFQGFSIEQ